jgi:hypothetical protein
MMGCALAMAGCDPVLDAKREALGGEAPGVRRGPFHRPGQPCLVCHRDGGEAPTFSAAGTVFRDPMALEPVYGATVELIDEARTHFIATTNCVGNFFVGPREWTPKFPIWATVRFGDISIDMESSIHLNGDCASCHADPVGPATSGHVFLTEDAAVIPKIPVAQCD